MDISQDTMTYEGRGDANCLHDTDRKGSIDCHDCNGMVGIDQESYVSHS
jgi:hypothetical protein